MQNQEDPMTLLNKTRLLNKTSKTTKPQFLAWLTAFVGWVFDYYEIALMTFLVVPIAQEFHLSPQQTALLLSLQLLGIAGGGVLFGFLGDKIGRQRVLVLTLLIFGVFTLARAFAPDFNTLLVFGVVAAIGLGGEFGVGQALVSEVMPAHLRGWWSGALYSGVGLGLAAAALVGGYLLPLIGWRWVFAVSCFPIVLALMARFAAPESDLWEKQQAKTKHTTDWKLIRSRRFIKPFLLCLATGSVEFFAYYGVASFLPTYLIEYQGFSFGKAAWWTVVTGIAIFAGSVMAGFLADRLGRRVTWTIMASIAAAGSVVVAISFEASIQSYWVLLPIFVLYFGVGVTAMFGLVFREQFPTRVRSFGMGSALQIARGVSFFPPLIAAAVYPIYGYSVLVYGGAVLFAILAVLGWLFKENAGRDILELELDFQDPAAPVADGPLVMRSIAGSDR
jgi:MFS family permease